MVDDIDRQLGAICGHAFDDASGLENTFKVGNTMLVRKYNNVAKAFYWCGAAHILLTWDIIHRQFQCFFLSLMSYRDLHIIKSQSGTHP